MQLPKSFTRTASGRKFSLTKDRPTKVQFGESNQIIYEWDPEEEDDDVRLIPCISPTKDRPSSRSKFDETMPKIQADVFVSAC